MSTIHTEKIRVRGRNRTVPSVAIGERTIVVAASWLGIASIATLKDEEFIEGEPVEDPESCVDALKRSALGADIFAFNQRFMDLTPKHPFRMEWDNVAALPIQSYQRWLDSLSVSGRKNLKRSSRKGVVVREAAFDDEFVNGLVEIYRESPVRQRRSFWHYGKNFETVKEEAGTYLDRSLFLGAYFEERLIGFAKIVFVDRLARFMQILCMKAHEDKRAIHALIAKSVEICDERRCSHLTYGKYTYGNSGYTSLTEFKVRNGFQQVLIPRYFIPLTAAGRIAMALGVHRGVNGMLPESLMRLLLKVRSRFSGMRARLSGAGITAEAANEGANASPHTSPLHKSGAAKE